MKLGSVCGVKSEAVAERFRRGEQTLERKQIVPQRALRFAGEVIMPKCRNAGGEEVGRGSGDRRLIRQERRQGTGTRVGG
jgi:hypothetical protein